MTKYIIIILTLLLSITGRAQERFFNFIDGWVSGHSIETSDGYIVIGNESNGNPDQHKLLYHELDFQGGLSNLLEFELPNVYTTTVLNTSSTTIEMESGIHLSAGYYIDLTSPSDSQHVAIYQYDETLGTVDTLMTFSDANWSLGYSLEKVNDSNFLLLASLADSGTFILNSRLYSVNIDGTVNWTYDSSCGYACRRFPEEVIQLSDGRILILMREWDFDFVPGHERLRTVLTLIDANGNHLWTRYPGDDENYHINPGGICEVATGEILVTYSDQYYYDDDGEWHWNDTMTVHLEYIDVDGNTTSTSSLLWDLPNNLTVPGSVRYDINQNQLLSDGSILISGSSYRAGLLIKVVGQDFVVWYQEHEPHPDGENDDAFEELTFIYHVLETSDGGFLCTGTYDSSPGILYPGGIQTAFALKLDENGCLSEGCQVGIEEYLLNELKVWPNPASEVIFFELPDYIRTDRMSYMVYDSNSRVVHEGNLNSEHAAIDVGTLPSGLYSLILFTEDRHYLSRVIVE